MSDLLSFPSFVGVPPDEWPWPHFTPYEMRCQGSGVVVVARAFMDRLERIRERFGEPMPITSGYRTPEHNRRVSTTGLEGPHTTGRAVDVKIHGDPMLRLASIAYSMGCTGFGYKQKGPRHLRFLHLDDLEDAPGCPRPWPWSY